MTRYTSDPILRMLDEDAGFGQVLFDTDLPYLRRNWTIRTPQLVRYSAALSEAELRSSEAMPPPFWVLNKIVLTLIVITTIVMS